MRRTAAAVLVWLSVTWRVAQVLARMGFGFCSRFSDVGAPGLAVFETRVQRYFATAACHT
jgi:hypothetical protein